MLFLELYALKSVVFFGTRGVCGHQSTNAIMIPYYLYLNTNVINISFLFCMQNFSKHLIWEWRCNIMLPWLPLSGLWFCCWVTRPGGGVEFLFSVMWQGFWYLIPYTKSQSPTWEQNTETITILHECTNYSRMGLRTMIDLARL